MSEIMKDIPTPVYFKAAIWLARLMRKWGVTRAIVKECKDRIIWGPAMRNHLSVAHALRAFAINVDRNLQNKDQYLYLQMMADACRDVVADMLYLEEPTLHCTIKLLDGTPNDPKKAWRVSTVARSTPCGRPAEYRPTYHTVGKNSSFAAIVGCSDSKMNPWRVPYSCFCCNNLSASDIRYADSREAWDEYYLSALVLSLRLKRIPTQKNFEIIGFLTFDSPYVNAFTGMPNIFNYLNKNERDKYEEKLKFRSLFHYTASMADILTTVLYMKFEGGITNG